MPKTTYIVGAGASKEFGLPLGVELRDKIVGRLRSREQAHRRIPDVLAEHLGESGANVTEAIARLTRALQTAESIDDVLGTFRSDAVVQAVGKWSIVTLIMEAEASSSLASRNAPHGENIHHDARRAWLSELFRQVAYNASLDELPSRLQQLRFITFNYDRTLERCLSVLFQERFKIGPERAGEFVEMVKIQRPYGWIAPPSGEGGIEYGSDAGLAMQCIDNIQTLHEGGYDEAVKLSRSLIATADRIVFLGFSFWWRNMELLTSRDAKKSRQRAVWGTALDQSDVGIADAAARIRRMAGEHIEPRLYKLKCAELVTQHRAVWGFDRD